MIFEAEPKDGFSINAKNTMYPSEMIVFKNAGERVVSCEGGSIYGYVVSGSGWLGNNAFEQINLKSGNFFAVPDVATLSLVDGSMIVCIKRWGLRVIPQVGAREEKGRLSYIDGCSDTCLVQPARLGDACLNHLHFPEGILQTQHTHPSIRMGIVAKGEGLAWRGKRGRKEELEGFLEKKNENDLVWQKPLTQGGVFMLVEQELHSFATPTKGMDIIAFHPDSDWGPTDETHPMLNRTHINNQV